MLIWLIWLLFFYLVKFVADSVATVVRCLESIGQAVVRKQAGNLKLRSDVSQNFFRHNG